MISTFGSETFCSLYEPACRMDCPAVWSGSLDFAARSAYREVDMAAFNTSWETTTVKLGCFCSRRLHLELILRILAPFRVFELSPSDRHAIKQLSGSTYAIARAHAHYVSGHALPPRCVSFFLVFLQMKVERLSCQWRYSMLHEHRSFDLQYAFVN